MVTQTKYTYSIVIDFPNHRILSDSLTYEIIHSSIFTILDYINTADDNCDIWFADILSVPEQDTLNQVVAAHQGNPLVYNIAPTFGSTFSIINLDDIILVSSEQNLLIYQHIDISGRIVLDGRLVEGL